MGDQAESATCGQCGELIESIEVDRCFYCTGIMCFRCWDEGYGACRGCTKAAKEWAAKMASFRVAKGKMHTGRPKVRRRCDICGKFFGARELRLHKREHSACTKIGTDEGGLEQAGTA
jgi:hypothetical protein